jgi:hypothetical protein
VSFKRTDFCNSRKTFRKPGGGSERNDEDANRGGSFRLRDGNRGVPDGHDFLHLHPREVRTVLRLYFNFYTGFFFQETSSRRSGRPLGAGRTRMPKLVTCFCRSDRRLRPLSFEKFCETQVQVATIRRNFIFLLYGCIFVFLKSHVRRQTMISTVIIQHKTTNQNNNEKSSPTNYTNVQIL